MPPGVDGDAEEPKVGVRNTKGEVGGARQGELRIGVAHSNFGRPVE